MQIDKVYEDVAVENDMADVNFFSEEGRGKTEEAKEAGSFMIRTISSELKKQLKQIVQICVSDMDESSDEINAKEFSNRTIASLMSYFLVEENVLNKEVMTDDYQAKMAGFFYGANYVLLTEQELSEYVMHTFGYVNDEMKFTDFYEQTTDGKFKIKIPIGDLGTFSIDMGNTVEIVGENVTFYGKWSSLRTVGYQYVEVNGRKIPIAETEEVRGDFVIKGYLDELSLLDGYAVNTITLVENVSDSVFEVEVNDVTTDIWKKVIHKGLNELASQSKDIYSLSVLNGFEFIALYYLNKRPDYQQEEVFKEIIYDKSIKILAEYIDGDTEEIRYAVVEFPNARILENGGVYMGEYECMVRVGITSEFWEQVLEQTDEFYVCKEIEFQDFK